eukprot:2196095-Pyramimonas_sp.AAC.1
MASRYRGALFTTMAAGEVSAPPALATLEVTLASSSGVGRPGSATGPCSSTTRAGTSQVSATCSGTHPRKGMADKPHTAHTALSWAIVIAAQVHKTHEKVTRIVAGNGPPRGAWSESTSTCE